MEKIPIVIMAAGKGSRFIPLSNTTPKPLIKIAGKTPIEYNLDSALPYISEIILIVGHLNEKIKEYFGSEYKGVPIIYVEQEDQLGNAHALNFAKDQVKDEECFIMYGDDIYEKQVFDSVAHEHDVAVGQKEQNWQNFGIYQTDSEGYLQQIVEKPQEFVGDLANIGVFKFKKDIFSYFDKIQKSSREEYEFTDMVSLYAKDHKVKVIECHDCWIPLSYPWHILSATEKMLSRMESKNEGTIEPGAVVKGTLILGKGSVVKAGAYLEGNFMIGEHSIIGPNCYLKEFGVVGNNSEVGNGSELCRSVIGNEVYMKHLAYVGDSILGDNVNVAAGCITSNFKHNAATVRMMVNGNLVDTGRQKLGTIIGDNARLGANTVIYPGRKIYNDVWTLPGEVVDKDKTA